MKARLAVVVIMVLLLTMVAALAPKDATCIYCGPCNNPYCRYVDADLIQLHAKTSPYQGTRQYAIGHPLPHWTVWCVAEWSGDGHWVLKLLEGPYAGYYVDGKDTYQPPPPPR